MAEVLMNMKQLLDNYCAYTFFFLLIFVPYVHLVFELWFCNIKLPRFIEHTDTWSGK